MSRERQDNNFGRRMIELKLITQNNIKLLNCIVGTYTSIQKYTDTVYTLFVKLINHNAETTQW